MRAQGRAALAGLNEAASPFAVGADGSAWAAATAQAKALASPATRGGGGGGARASRRPVYEPDEPDADAAQYVYQRDSLTPSPLASTPSPEPSQEVPQIDSAAAFPDLGGGGGLTSPWRAPLPLALGLTEESFEEARRAEAARWAAETEQRVAKAAAEAARAKAEAEAEVARAELEAAKARAMGKRPAWAESPPKSLVVTPSAAAVAAQTAGQRRADAARLADLVGAPVPACEAALERCGGNVEAA